MTHIAAMREHCRQMALALRASARDADAGEGAVLNRIAARYELRSLATIADAPIPQE